MPVRLSANPPGPVPFHRIPKFPCEGKGNSVIGQSVFQPEQLRTLEPKPFPAVKNRPDIYSFL
jgi:hypothetical protein